MGRLGVAGRECRVAGAFPLSLVRAARVGSACLQGHRQGLTQTACGVHRDAGSLSRIRHAARGRAEAGESPAVRSDEHKLQAATPAYNPGRRTSLTLETVHAYPSPHTHSC